LSAHGNCPHGHARAPFLARRPRRNLVPLGKEKTGDKKKGKENYRKRELKQFSKLDYGQIA